MTQVLIKRSLETATPASLANGELAWTSNGDILYIGANDVIVPIGSKRTPGVLTANQAIVANSTGMIDVIRMGNSTVNAVVNSTSLSLANSTVTITIVKPTAAEAAGANFLRADGTWAEAGSGEAAGSNTQVQFNDSDAFGGSAGFTFDKAANNLSVANTIDVAVLRQGNSTVNVYSNSVILMIRNATSSANHTADGFIAGTSVVNTTAFAAGANVILGIADLKIGNSTVNSLSNSVLFTLRNASATANLAPAGLVVGTSTVNATHFVAGANVFLSTVALSMGNSTVNALANSVLLTIRNATNIANLEPGALTIGSSVVNSTAIAVQDAVISGNLTINGSLTTIDTTSLVVEDPLIKLSKNNDSADTLDIGLYGLCDPSGSQDTYTGLFRDATDSKWKFFELLQTEPTTTVDTGGTGYVPAWVVCNLESANVNITGGIIDAGTF